MKLTLTAQNLMANFGGQFWGILLSVASIPFYVSILGVEAYGLIAFFVMLQAWLVILDMGMGPTVGRELSRMKAGAASEPDSKTLFNSLELIFVCFSVLLFWLGWIWKVEFAELWFEPKEGESILLATKAFCFGTMIGVFSIRWVVGLYNGALIGLERHLLLNVVASSFQTVRFLGVLPVIYFFPDVKVFFSFQLFFVLVEFLVVRGFVVGSLGAIVGARAFDFSILKKHAGFALSLAFTTSVWVLVSQFDKALLATLLTLQEFGYFSLAVFLASGVSLVTAPIIRTFQPRMTILDQSENKVSFYQGYHSVSRIVCLVVFPIAGVFIAFPQFVLLGWLGDAEIAHKGEDILRYYGLGNLLVSLMNVSYLAQFARGKLRLHILGSISFLAVLIPSMLFAATHYGTQGAAICWAMVNALYFLVWPPIIHRIILDGGYVEWMKTLFSTLLPPIIVLILLRFAFEEIEPGRILSVFLCVVAWASMFLVMKPWVTYREFVSGSDRRD